VENFNQKITTFLMFSGKAEEAMNFYTSLFDSSEIVSISRYGANEAGVEGTVIHAAFSLKGQILMPLAVYPFSEKFGWVADKYGVSWQLNLG
jgi:predicted 3-demethylubiquinone-9 3-methyltransferase (glyoxalase superfamily)